MAFAAGRAATSSASLELPARGGDDERRESGGVERVGPRALAHKIVDELGAVGAGGDVEEGVSHPAVFSDLSAFQLGVHVAARLEPV